MLSGRRPSSDEVCGMKALVYHGNKDLRLETVPDPTPGPGDILLRIDYCGICATDIEEYLYGPVFIFGDEPNPITGKKVPLITGHEITGTVDQTGQGVSNVGVGDRVALNTVLTCGDCWWCRNGAEVQCPAMAVAGFALDGGLAEYMVWPASEAIPLPDSVSSEEAALVEPASVAVQAVRRSRMAPGESVAVLGVGAVGMLAMQAAKAMGGRVFAIDRRESSLEMAGRLGADAVIDAADDVEEALRGLTGGTGPDVVIDAAGGEETPAQAVRWVRSGGRALLVAIYASTPAFDFNDIVGTAKEIIGSIAYQRRDVEQVVGLLDSDQLQTAPPHLRQDRPRRGHRQGLRPHAGTREGRGPHPRIPLRLARCRRGASGSFAHPSLFGSPTPARDRGTNWRRATGRRSRRDWLSQPPHICVKLDTNPRIVLDLHVRDAGSMAATVVGMHINVSQLMREPSGSSRSVRIDDTVAVALGSDRSRVHGTVGLLRTDRGVWVSASLRSQVSCSCSRCLDEIEQPLELSIDEEFLPIGDSGAHAADVEANYIREDHILDLTETVRQYIGISAPMKPVCSSACLGLCPKCGANLNETRCICGRTDIDSRWAALLELAPAQESPKGV